MSKYIVLLDADMPSQTRVIKEDDDEDAFDPFAPNMVFRSAEEADTWVQSNAKNGWCTLIVEVEQ